MNRTLIAVATARSTRILLTCVFATLAGMLFGLGIAISSRSAVVFAVVLLALTALSAIAASVSIEQ